jgi:uncharacterized protein (TIGR02246 family)
MTAIKAALASFVHAFNASDARSLAALFADDAEFVNIFGMWMRGRAGIEVGHAHGFGGPLAKSTIVAGETHVKLVRPDVALCHIRWSRGASPGLPAAGGVLSVVMIQNGEEWSMVSGHNTESRSPPGPGGGPKVDGR